MQQLLLDFIISRNQDLIVLHPEVIFRPPDTPYPARTPKLRQFLSRYVVSTDKSMSMAKVTMSKSTCSVSGRMPLCSGRKECVPEYMVR
jgi:hypothetical protein